jgi:hypothetical protein
MKSRFLSLLLLASVSLSSGAVAQTSSPDLRFVIPLNLSNLPADMSRIAVECDAGLPPGGKESMRKGRYEVAVVDGMVDTVVTVVIATAGDPWKPGQTLSYTCALLAYSSARNTWITYGEKLSPDNRSFALSPTPAPITGSFVW